MWAVRRALCGQFAASDGVMAGEVRKEAVASGKLEVKVALHDRPCELCSMKVDAEKRKTRNARPTTSEMARMPKKYTAVLYPESWMEETAVPTRPHRLKEAKAKLLARVRASGVWSLLHSPSFDALPYNYAKSNLRASIRVGVERAQRATKHKAPSVSGRERWRRQR